MQLSASIAGTCETCAVRETCVAALFADEPSVQTRLHGPELNAEHAIGTADNFWTHRKLGRTAKQKTKIGVLLVTAARAVRWR